ncbi:hypothetical protein [Natranaerofaba carboxydovora]|uniref:hypothetical protein n=1 Tax=Natranaerofaba carboxydovora TaxID=2742683 RepID=UPI001F14016A|nr:hypothetical protein [Natranaerofaba carboxydovora]UMZ72817.1 hypothetical protein ACONDI_00347 [Natranaerofaba carboxydovora]
MHELLEQLNKSFDDKFKQEVSLTEITRFSLNLHRSAAIVVTNNYIYTLNKKLFSVNVNKLPLVSLEDIFMEDNKLKLKIAGEIYRLPVSSSKKNTVMKFVNEVKALKEK